MPRDDATIPTEPHGMAARVAAFDWAATPLGPMAEWPASLRIAADLVLSAASPALLAWGEEFIVLHNDHYLPILGTEREALGRPFLDVWSEVREEVEPVLRRAREGHAVRFVEAPFILRRGAATEERWFNYTFSPVRRTGGQAGGVLLLIVESTNAVLAVRRRDALIALGDALRGLEDPAEIAARGAKVLGETLRVPRAGYGTLDETGDRLTVARDWHAAEIPSAAGVWDASAFWPGFAAELRRGEPSAVADVATDPRTAAQHGAFAAVQIAACFHAPVLRDGRLAALVFLHDTGPRAWTDSEIVFARDVAGRLAAATERAEALAALRESEDHHRHAVELQPQTSWTARPDGQLDRVSHRWMEWTGTTGLGSTWAEGLHPDDAARTFEVWSRSVGTGETYDIHHRMKMRDGSFRWAHSRAYPRRDAAGAIVRWYGVTEDVHDRFLAQEALRTSEARFRAIVTGPEAIVWRAEPDGAIAEAPGWEVLTGQTPERYRGAGWLDAVHPDDVPPTIAVWAGALGTGDPVNVDYRVRTRGGGWRWMHAYGVTVRDDAGRVIEWVGTVTDVQDRRTAEEERAASEARLRDLNATLEARVAERTAERDRLWRISRDLFVVLGADGVVRAVNPAVRAILGYEPEEWIGKHYSTLVVQDDHAASEAAREAALRGPLDPFENRYRHRDGSVRRISWVAAPEGDLIVATGRDVTAERAVDAALLDAQEQLRQAQKMEAVGQLTGGIAHDFNNMLAVVMGGLALMRRRLERGETDVMRYVDAAMEGAGRAAALTQRLLAFSRQQSLSPSPLEVNALVAGMSELLGRTLGERIRVETNLAPDLAPVHADRVQLESTLLNLSVNARDAMPDGGTLTIGTANVRITPAQARRIEVSPGDYVRITVGDTGTGMAPEVAARAFDPFFTTKGVGKGTGLGLSQVFGFVRQSGGHVAIGSAPGKGTTITIVLPRHAGAAPVAAQSAQAAADGARGETVLVVEDEERVRALAVESLRDLGYRVLEAASAEEALPIIEGPEPIALLFTDVIMPGMGGPRLAEIAAARRPGLRVLFATGFAEGGVPAGAPVLVKPFTLDVLAARLRAVLDAGRDG
ncbi:PAS domain-containing protein [Roseomonas sp. CCTCC AB2023176]|uniref:PAS domain-containing protein n=1 Tax=Roseomonas sp. CCTCC AB2023176 TaxID=3342640 RepID=UPI0035E12220